MQSSQQEGSGQWPRAVSWLSWVWAVPSEQEVCAQAHLLGPGVVTSGRGLRQRAQGCDLPSCQIYQCSQAGKHKQSSQEYLHALWVHFPVETAAQAHRGMQIHFCWQALLHLLNTSAVWGRGRGQAIKSRVSKGLISLGSVLLTTAPQLSASEQSHLLSSSDRLRELLSADKITSSPTSESHWHMWWWSSLGLGCSADSGN